MDLEIPKWAFTPDEWSDAFLRGLQKVVSTWKGKSIWEVGVGTGNNIISLLKLAQASELYFSDLNPKCTEIALSNILRFVRPTKIPTALHGSWDLITPPKESNIKAPMVDIIFACIPQVPAKIDLSLGDNMAHYYNPLLYSDTILNKIGLGLCQNLLIKAKEILLPNGKVILNLGGRPGLERLNKLFTETGYEPNILWEEVIPQHMETSLESLAKLEENGEENFELFANPECTQVLNALEAEKLRKKGIKFYHKIYVIEGTMI